MADILTKFSIGDACYTFDSTAGNIVRYVVIGINAQISSSSVIDIIYTAQPSITPNALGTFYSSSPTISIEEQLLYTAVEVTELANAFLVQKSVSIFTNAGL